MVMAEPLSDYEAALAAVRQANLKHPDGPLLESYLDDAIDRDWAAAFLLKRLTLHADTSDGGIGAFLAGWKRTIAVCRRYLPTRKRSIAWLVKLTGCDSLEVVRDAVGEPTDRSVVASVAQRDGVKCCITGLPGSFWDPLIAVRILPRMRLEDISSDSCREMLGAFLTPELRAQLLSHAEKESEAHNSVENHWLLRKSAAAAFAQGYFQLSFTSRRKPKYEVLKVLTGGPCFPPILDKVEDFRRGSLVDASSSNINIPNRWALEILSHFATPLRWTFIAQEIAEKQRKPSRASLSFPFRSTLSFLSDAWISIFKTLWPLVPGSLRIRTYRTLASLGAYMYGPAGSFNVQQLPFGLYLKTVSLARRESLVNEHAAMELVRRHTDVPVPRALDLVSDSSDIYLLTTRVPGYKLGQCLDTMSDEDTAALVRELRRHIAALRALPRPPGWKYAISNAAGGPCFDYRINAALVYDEERGEVVGPFLSEDEFNETLRCGALPGVVHRSGHEMVFTHGDLNMRNVIVDERGRLTGIIDWENAGWFPEYWDYTKAYFVTKLNRRWLGMVDDVFGQFGDYGRELGVERELWNYCF